MLSLWLSLFKANTEEELEKIKAMEVPVMNQAIDAYYSITASSEFRELERLREKAGHDEAQALYHAEQKGRTEGLTEGLAKGRAEGRTEGISNRNIEIAQFMLADGEPISKILRYTGLSSEELKAINR